MDDQDEREVSEIADQAEHDGADQQRLERTVSCEDDAKTGCGAHPGSVTHVHGYEWHRENVLAPIGGPIRKRYWVLCLAVAISLLEVTTAAHDLHWGTFWLSCQ
jgi:hypothetical protein